MAQIVYQTDVAVIVPAENSSSELHARGSRERKFVAEWPQALSS